MTVETTTRTTSCGTRTCSGTLCSDSRLIHSAWLMMKPVLVVDINAHSRLHTLDIFRGVPIFLLQVAEERSMVCLQHEYPSVEMFL